MSYGDPQKPTLAQVLWGFWLIVAILVGVGIGHAWPLSSGQITTALIGCGVMIGWAWALSKVIGWPEEDRD